MNRKTPPPIGYFISDYEKEIRKICVCLENDGMQYKLLSDFVIQYSSDELVIEIAFERYGDVVTIDYIVGNSEFPLQGKCDQSSYSLAWTVSEIANSKDIERLKGMSKLEKISFYIGFFRANREMLIDKKTADRIKESYEQIGI